MAKIGLQLYSIKELTESDFLGTIEKVARIGYDGVEFAGYFNTRAKDLRNCLAAAGIAAAGSHIGIESLREQLDACIEYSNEINSPYIIVPYIPEEMRNSLDAYKATAEEFNKIGEKCRKNGILFGYHNHEFEFEKFGGEFGLDLLVNHTAPENFFIELDTYWVEYSRLKSVDFVNKYKERCKILHIKDMKSMEDMENTEIGKGIMDFKGITAASLAYNPQWFTVEQEAFEIPQLQSIEESLRYLKGIL